MRNENTKVRFFKILHILLAFLMRALGVSSNVLIISIHLIRRDCVIIFTVGKWEEEDDI